MEIRPYPGISKRRDHTRHTELARRLRLQRARTVEAVKQEQAKMADYQATLETKIFGPDQARQDRHLHHTLASASSRSMWMGMETNKEDIDLYRYKDYISDQYFHVYWRRLQAVNNVGRSKSRELWNQHIAGRTSDTYFGPYTWPYQEVYQKDPMAVKLWELKEEYKDVARPSLWTQLAEEDAFT